MPGDFKATEVSPWLICKNRNEVVDGNFGIVIRHDGVPQGRINIGGGRENAHVVEASRSLKLESWNHLALSYDDDTFRFFTNGQLAGEKKIGKKRQPTQGGLAFGRRQDNSGSGYRFRGVVDEIRLYDRALTIQELRLHYVKPEVERPALKPIGEWRFSENGQASMTKLSEQWKEMAMEVKLNTEKGSLQSRWELPEGEVVTGSKWRVTSLAVNPITFQKEPAKSGVTVRASEVGTGTERPVEYDQSIGWHRVNLDGIEPTNPPGIEGPSNDAIERVKLFLSNTTNEEQVARLMFEKTARGFRQRIGTPITGISAILRDKNGNPTGIPVQLSKNWHNHSEGGMYSGQWFHGISQIRLPPAREIELELVLVYGHWGGVPAASHSQLSLVGWGGNQLWDQSALGAWGESICFNPEQTQAKCTITDVRPLMVHSMGDGRPWSWTSNVGGGDFFRLFNPSGERIPHAAMRTTYHRQGPCLTEVNYAGRVGGGLHHSTTVSLARSDDLVRGTYRIRLDVKKATDFSRFVIFQIGADTYSSTSEKKMAIGNETGLLREWDTQWGGDNYKTKPMECTGRIPWVSLHEGVPRENQKPGPIANRGIVIRDWKARLGGQDNASPWMAERGVKLGGKNISSTLDILPPPGVTRLEPGDFVEATIEHIIVPQFAKDYYGPNETLKAALSKHENTWRMIRREAVGNDRKVKMKVGTLERRHPDIRIKSGDDSAHFELTGGIGYVPITFFGLRFNSGYHLKIDGLLVDQSVHGNDFWQTDFDPVTGTWSRTYNFPIYDRHPHELRLSRKALQK